MLTAITVLSRLRKKSSFRSRRHRGAQPPRRESRWWTVSFRDQSGDEICSTMPPAGATPVEFDQLAAKESDRQEKNP
jgi:hypothetical protein